MNFFSFEEIDHSVGRLKFILQYKDNKNQENSISENSNIQAHIVVNEPTLDHDLILFVQDEKDRILS